MNKVLILLLLGICPLSIAYANALATARDLTLVGTSDLVVIGQLVNPDSSSVQERYGNTLVITRTLKGPGMEKVVLYSQGLSQESITNLALAQHLLFLRLTSGNRYMFTDSRPDNLSVRQVEEAEKFIALIKNYPIEVTIQSPNHSLYFDRRSKLTSAVHNPLTNPEYKLWRKLDVRVEGFYQSPILPDLLNLHQSLVAGTIFFDPQHPPIRLHDYTFSETVDITCTKPESWAVLQPDSYLQTPIALRAVFRIQAGNINNFDPIFEVASPWVFSTTGFPVPEMIQSPTNQIAISPGDM